MRVAWIGAGRMGSPMAKRVAEAGHAVAVHAREVADRDGLMAAGARICASAAEAVAGAELACICVFDQAQAREVALGADAILPHLAPGAILAIHSTCSASAVREIAAAAGPAVSVLDAPFSGQAAGELTMLVGGEAAAIERARGVFMANARTVFRVGDVGAGQRTKLINQFLYRANVAAADSALRLLENEGGERKALVQALMECSGRSFALANFAAGQSIATATENFRPYFEAYSAAAAEDGLSLGPLLRRGDPDSSWPDSSWPDSSWPDS